MKLKKTIVYSFFIVLLLIVLLIFYFAQPMYLKELPFGYITVKGLVGEIELPDSRSTIKLDGSWGIEKVDNYNLVLKPKSDIVLPIKKTQRMISLVVKSEKNITIADDVIWKNLERLSLTSAGKINIQGMLKCKSLTTLKLNSWGGGSGLENIKRLTSVTNIEICSFKSKLSFFDNLILLRSLRINSSGKISNILLDSCLSKLKSLEKLYLDGYFTVDENCINNTFPAIDLVMLYFRKNIHKNILKPFRLVNELHVYFYKKDQGLGKVNGESLNQYSNIQKLELSNLFLVRPVHIGLERLVSLHLDNTKNVFLGNVTKNIKTLILTGGDAVKLFKKAKKEGLKFRSVVTLNISMVDDFKWDMLQLFPNIQILSLDSVRLNENTLIPLVGYLPQSIKQIDMSEYIWLEKHLITSQDVLLFKNKVPSNVKIVYDYDEISDADTAGENPEN